MVAHQLENLRDRLLLLLNGDTANVAHLKVITLRNGGLDEVEELLGGSAASIHLEGETFFVASDGELEGKRRRALRRNQIGKGGEDGHGLR